MSAGLFHGRDRGEIRALDLREFLLRVVVARVIPIPGVEVLLYPWLVVEPLAMNRFHLGGENTQLGVRAPDELACRKRAIAIEAHVPKFDRRVGARFRPADYVEVASLHVVEHRVVKVRVWFVPVLPLEKALDFLVFEHASVPSEHNAAEFGELMRCQLPNVGRRDGIPSEVETDPPCERIACARLGSWLAACGLRRLRRLPGLLLPVRAAAGTREEKDQDLGGRPRQDSPAFGSHGLLSSLVGAATKRRTPSAMACAIRRWPASVLMKLASAESVNTTISMSTTGTRENIDPVRAPCQEPTKVRESPRTPLSGKAPCSTAVIPPCTASAARRLFSITNAD